MRVYSTDNGWGLFKDGSVKDEVRHTDTEEHIPGTQEISLSQA